MDVPHGGAPILVGARTGQNLYLPYTSPGFGIDWRDNHTDFLDQILVDCRIGIHANRAAVVLDADAVPRRVHGAISGIDAGKRRRGARRSVCSFSSGTSCALPHAGHDVHQIQCIAAHVRKVRHGCFCKHRPD